MNERIKLLAEQAGAVFEKTNGLNDCPQDSLVDDEIQKFAELIVRECADILMKPEYAMNHPEELGDYNKGWVSGRLLGIEHIKEHFGVEV
jgi:hypothetical protein